MDENVAMIPYYVHEGEMTRMERVVKRLWIALLIIFLAFVGTNLGWIIYENQFETISYEQDADFDGDVDMAIANNGTGDVTYGLAYPSESQGSQEEGFDTEWVETLP